MRFSIPFQGAGRSFNQFLKAQVGMEQDILRDILQQVPSEHVREELAEKSLPRSNRI